MEQGSAVLTATSDNLLSSKGPVHESSPYTGLFLFFAGIFELRKARNKFWRPAQGHPDFHVAGIANDGLSVPRPVILLPIRINAGNGFAVAASPAEVAAASDYFA